jgi:hypothetical protein
MTTLPSKLFRSKPFWRFILNPDEPISLNSYFDNLKNYAVSCALFGIGLALYKEIDDKLVSYCLFAIASICIMLNAIQLYLILYATFQQFIGLSLEEYLSRDEKIKAQILLKLKIFIWIPIIVLAVTYYIFYFFLSKLAP